MRAIACFIYQPHAVQTYAPHYHRNGRNNNSANKRRSTTNALTTQQMQRVQMQRVQDIVANMQGQEVASPGIGAIAGNTTSSLTAGGGTFGAVGAANLILQN